MPDPDRSKPADPQAETIKRAIDEFSHPLRSPPGDRRAQREAGHRGVRHGAGRDRPETSD